jgi:hypothetical protein
MHTDGRTDRQTDMTQLIVAFNNSVNAPIIEAWIEKQTKRAKLRQGLRLAMTPLKRSLVRKRSAMNKQHRPRPWLDVLEMTAGLGHSHRRAFSLKRNFVTHVDNGTLISELRIYYGKKFSLKRRVFRPIHTSTDLATGFTSEESWFDSRHG